MAVVETVKKRSANCQLEDGIDSSGNMKYVSLSFGALAKDAWDADKLFNIKNALAPCLSKTIGSVETTVTSAIAQQT